jgi:TRAP-type mannitol/chloroaromatic compound transport system permease large subunit
VWFACIVAVVLQTAFLSPPVAMSAYYLKQVVKEWNLATIYRGMADFMVIQCICVALVMIFPQIAMWFPNWLQERAKAERMRDKSSLPPQPVPVADASRAEAAR